jgi:uncharacterized protein
VQKELTMEKKVTCFLISIFISCVIYPIQGISQTTKATAFSIPVKEFPLNQVKLLDGPFKDAMDRDIAWLKSVNADRLLVAFRKTAGLPATAKPYGGWEGSDEKMDGIRGHYLGHYLSACAKAYVNTGDKDIKTRIDYIIKELTLCQDKIGDGYIGAFPETMFDDLNQGKDVRWVPWYTMHKIFAGLFDVYNYASNPQVYQVLMKLTDWAKKKTDGLSADEMQKVLKREQGGMTEVLADIYSVTQKPDHLVLTRRFDHLLMLDNMSGQKDILSGLHANTQIPKMIGAAREYEVTSDPAYRKAAEFFWDRVVNHYSSVTGGNSFDEHFKDPDKIAAYLPISDADETCNAYNMLKLTEHLFSWSGDVRYTDYYERALINCILASQSTSKYDNMPAGMMTYHQPLQAGLWKRLNDPENCFWCCTGTGSENHVQYGKLIYSSDKEGLYINLFIASQLNWTEKKMTVKQETLFPDDNTTKISFTSTGAPSKIKVRVRIPYWTSPGVNIKINGHPYAAKIIPGSYLTIERFWTNKDIMEIYLPMSLHKEPTPDDKGVVAFMYGPMVLSGKLGTEGLNVQTLFGTNGEPSFHKIKDEKAPAIPKFTGVAENLDTWIKPVPGKTLTFQTAGKGSPADVTLIPYYKQFFERYNLYWNVSNDSTAAVK